MKVQQITLHQMKVTTNKVTSAQGHTGYKETVRENYCKEGNKRRKILKK